jgi:hypothetical protein
VVLASYTWSDDAMRWDSLSDDEHYRFALDNMARLFRQQVYNEYTGVGVTQSWTRNRYALGEAAIYTPGQLHEHHAATRTVEGRVHFAGQPPSHEQQLIRRNENCSRDPRRALVGGTARQDLLARLGHCPGEAERSPRGRGQNRASE